MGGSGLLSTRSQISEGDKRVPSHPGSCPLGHDFEMGWEKAPAAFTVSSQAGRLGADSEGH